MYYKIEFWNGGELKYINYYDKLEDYITEANDHDPKLTIRIFRPVGDTYELMHLNEVYDNRLSFADDPEPDGINRMVVIQAMDEEEARESFQHYHWIPRPNSPYDCTGRSFTSSVDLIYIEKSYAHKYGRDNYPANLYFFIHRIGIDV